MPLLFLTIAFMLCGAVLNPGAALAHSGHGVVDEFAAGFMHSVMGLDHLLVAMAIGVLAAQRGDGKGGKIATVLLAASFAAWLGILPFLGITHAHFHADLTETALPGVANAIGLAAGLVSLLALGRLAGEVMLRRAGIGALQAGGVGIAFLGVVLMLVG